MDSAYERALKEVRPNGIFQKKFDILYNFVFTALWTMAYNNVLLVLVIIPHFCQLPEKPLEISELSWKSKYIPMSEDSNGKVSFSSCSIFINPEKSNFTRACDSYSYDKTWYESTVPSSNNWVCDNELYVANVFAYSKFGEIIGSVAFGWFGDIFGRRLTYVLSLGLLVIGRVLSVLASNSAILFMIGCIIAWFPSWSVVQSVTVISMEISSPERRSLTATLRSLAYSTGMCIMPFLYWWLRDWKPFMVVTTVTIIPFLLLSWKIIESPRWLWIKGKTVACVKQLKQIAKVNNATLETATENHLLTTPPEGNAQMMGPLSLFSGWKLATNTILQLYLWVAVSMSYTVLIMSSGEKSDGNPFLEFAWQSLVEVPGTFVGAWIADKIGRRYAGATSYFVSALMWVLLAIRSNGSNTWMQMWWIGSTLVVINRLSTTMCYYVIYLFNMELYPTCIRQSGMSLGNVFSSGACAVAPYLMYLGRRIEPRIPGVVLAIVAALGCLSSILLPETLNTKLPETLEDAQKFGKRKRDYISIELLHFNKHNTTTFNTDPE